MISKNKTDLLLFLFCTIIAIFILYYTLKYSAYGLDFTDEGFYLNWISNPYLYQTSISQFGFIYNPIYILANENIIWLRKINILFIYCLSFVLTFILISNISNIEKLNIIKKILISIAIASCSLNFIFIQTPSYNDLNFQGLLIVSIGILLIDNKNVFKNFLAHIILSFGVWITFLAKPSSFIGLIIMLLVYFIMTRNFQIRFILISITFFILLLIMTALLIDQSIFLYIKRYMIELKTFNLLQSYHGLEKIFRIDSLKLSYEIQISVLLIFLLSAILTWNDFKNNKYKNLFFILTSLFIISIIGININTNLNFNFGDYGFYQILGIFCACALINLIFIIKNKINFNDVLWSLMLFFLSLPYIFAMGSGNNYWWQGRLVLFFWLIASFILILPIVFKYKKFKSLISLILISQLIISIHIKERIDSPYRQDQSLSLSVYKMTSYKSKTPILSTEFQKYVNKVKDLIKINGFQKNDPMIDLSGQSPGLLYLIGAKSIGTPWNIGSYKGSFDLAKARFDLVKCLEISNSWIIFEPKGPRSISAELIHYLGGKFPDGYELIGYVQTPIGAGGYKKKRIQEIYKPRNNILTYRNCKEIRKKIN